MKTTKELFQWDINQKLVGVEGEYVDFLIEGEVYRIASMGGECLIPDEWLQTGGTKVIWECFSDNTRKAYKINIYDRPMPPDYVYTPTQKETFDTLVAKVDNAVADMYERAESGEFDGKDYVITEADYDAIAEKVEASLDVTEVLERLDEVEDELSDMEQSLSDKATKDELQLVNQKYNDLMIIKQDKLTSGYTIKTINGQSVLGSGNIQIQGSGVSKEYVDGQIGLVEEQLDTLADVVNEKQPKLVAGDNITIDPTTNVISATGGGSSDVTKTYVDQQDNLLGQAISNLGASTSQSISQLGQSKQDKLTSGTNIKTINGESVLGSGNIVIGGSGGDVTKAYVDEKDAELQDAIEDLDDTKQDKLTSGSNVKTVNGQSILGSGDLSTTIINGVDLKNAINDPYSDGGMVISNDYSLGIEVNGTSGASIYMDNNEDMGKHIILTPDPSTVMFKLVGDEGYTGAIFTFSTGSFYILPDGLQVKNNSVVPWNKVATSLSSSATESYVDGKVSTKQDTLVSGTNIKTINNMSILGSGNINISGGGGEDYTLIHHEKMTEGTDSAAAFDVTFTDNYKEINFVVAVPKTTLTTLTGALYVFDRDHVSENPTVTPDYMNIAGLKNKSYAVMFSGEIITFGNNTRGLYRHVAVNTPHTGANGLCLATTRDLPNIARLRIQFNGGADADTEIWVYGRK